MFQIAPWKSLEAAPPLSVSLPQTFSLSKNFSVMSSSSTSTHTKGTTPASICFLVGGGKCWVISKTSCLRMLFSSGKISFRQNRPMGEKTHQHLKMNISSLLSVLHLNWPTKVRLQECRRSTACTTKTLFWAILCLCHFEQNHRAFVSLQQF